MWHVIQLPCKWPRSKDTEKRGKVVTFQLSSGKNDKMGVVLGDLVTSRFVQLRGPAPCWPVELTGGGAH